jgi:hypothetical protein
VLQGSDQAAAPNFPVAVPRSFPRRIIDRSGFLDHFFGVSVTFRECVAAGFRLKRPVLGAARRFLGQGGDSAKHYFAVFIDLHAFAAKWAPNRSWYNKTVVVRVARPRA